MSDGSRLVVESYLPGAPNCCSFCGAVQQPGEVHVVRVPPPYTGGFAPATMQLRICAGCVGQAGALLASVEQAASSAPCSSA